VRRRAEAHVADPQRLSGCESLHLAVVSSDTLCRPVVPQRAFHIPPQLAPSHRIDVPSQMPLGQSRKHRAPVRARTVHDPGCLGLGRLHLSAK
jgi:hypothetical protein